MVILGVIFTLLVQEFWPERVDSLTQDVKSRAQGFVDSLPKGAPFDGDYGQPASPDKTVPAQPLTSRRTTDIGTPTEIPLPGATPVPSGLGTKGGTPPPQPAPTSQPKNTSTPLPSGRVTKDWIESLELEIHRLTNEERAHRSVSELSYDYKLASVARGHSRDMAQLDYFAHENRRGKSPTDRATQAEYQCRKDYGIYYTEGIAENIFQTSLYSSYTVFLGGRVVSRDYMTVAEIAGQVVDGWMESPGHRANILETSYDQEGIGVAVSSDEKVYVTQNFC